MSDAIGRAVIEVSADTTKLAAGIDGAKRSVTNLGATIGTSVADGSAKASRSIDAYIKKLEQSASTIGMSASQIKLVDLAQRGATDTQLKAADAAFRTLDAYKQQSAEARKAADAARTAGAIASASQALQGNSTKISANEMRNLGVQVKDFYESVVSGSSPLRAFSQQAGTSISVLGGFSSAMTKLGSLFTVTRVAVGGTVGAIAGFAVAAYDGHQQSAELAKALTLTGNAAGVTEGQFNAMAKSIASNLNITVSASREYALALLKTGEIGPQVFGTAAAAASGYAKMTGKTADEVAADFAKMAESPAKFAEQANKSFNFLTAVQYQAIKSFEDNGRAADAQGVIYEALLERSKRLGSSLGTLEKALESGKRAWSDFWDAAAGIGREETIDDKISRISKKIAELRDKQQTASAFSPDAGKTSTFSVVQPGGKGNAPQAAAQIAAAEAELADARRKQFRETENAYAESLNAQINKEGIAASAAVDGWLKRGKAASMYKQELDKLNRDFDKAALAGTPVSATDKQVALAAVKKQYTDSGAARNANRIDKAQLGLDVEKIKASLAILTSSYMNAENILEAQRAAGLIGEKAYYDQKRKLIQDQGVAETKGLEDETSRLKASKATGADALEVQKKLVDVQAQITIAKANTTTKVTTLDIQQKNSIDQVTRSYAEARIAAQDYLDTMSRGIDREVEAFPRGDKERNRVSARQQIEDRYTQQRLELENNKRLLEMQKDPDTGVSKFTSEARDKYNNQLAILDEYQAKALVKWDAGYKAIGALESDWSTGAQRAMENYVDTAANASRLSEGVFTNAFQSMEDAIVQFATTGKLSFGDLAKSIIADMARVQAKNLLASLIGGDGKGALGGGISGFLQQWATKSAIGTSSSPTNGMGIMGDVIAGARAAGGPVAGGSSYLVGEKEAETFKPSVFGIAVPAFSMPKQVSVAAKGNGDLIPKAEAINKPERLYEFACI